MSNQKTPANPSAVGAAEKPMNRRSMLKVAVATAPFIATLPSGAALARSSNLIGAAAPANAKDSKGRTLCLDLNSGTGDYQNGVLDLGAPARGNLSAINDRYYFTKPDLRSDLVSEADMCKQGGTYNYWWGEWRQVNVPRGILVSATALSSFAGSIRSTEI